jgi:ferrous iron transport protein B
MYLSDLENNESGIITKVQGRGAFRKRIMEMGFVKGKEVTVIKNAPLKDPIEYFVMGYNVSLRRTEAALIEIITKAEVTESDKDGYNGVFSEKLLRKKAIEKGKIINVALVGNPNSGKTTFFNFASDSQERVGNYSGVTVDSKVATFSYRGYTFNITDLPGTYSLTAYSPEELFVRRHIIDQNPDVIINVIDASNLERNLYLTTQLIDMDMKVVMCLNMYDELLAKKDKFDHATLGAMIGIPIIPVISKKGKGIKELFNTVIKVFNDQEQFVRHIHINYGKEVELTIGRIQNILRAPEFNHLLNKYSSRFLAIKLIEKDVEAKKIIESCENCQSVSYTVQKEIKRLEALYKDDSETILTDAKYGFIDGALKETYSGTYKPGNDISKKIDDYVTHKYLGIPIFLFLMWVMFQSTFSLGAFPKAWIETFINLLSSSLQTYFPAGSFKDLLIDGVLGGVGGVIVFLPNILILFFFISLMEDTGYMARAAFIMDKLMHKIGLHGKSFIPLLMGFGCNVPAIMSIRTIENRNNRLITMLINPFMSCSARLPVYVLLISAFFSKYAGLVLFSMYLIGVSLAAITAIIFKKTIFKAKEVPFVMELPPYRIPTAKSTFKHVWQKGSQYLQKMGGIILVASIIIWALGYFPINTKYSKPYSLIIEKTEKTYDEKITQLYDNNNINVNGIKKEKEEELQKIKVEMDAEHHQNSYIGQIGKFIEPAMQPLGFNWKMSISLLMGVSAKEIVVSTLAVLHQTDIKGNNASLATKLQEQTYSEGKNVGKKVFSPLVAYSYMLFILIYSPCIAVIAAIKKESGEWKWAIFSIIYSTTLAYLISMAVFQIGSLFG